MTRLSSALLLLFTLNIFHVFSQSKNNRPTTYCNPVNLAYRFQKSELDYRQGADPVMLLIGNTYWLFASKQTGYWHSNDMVNWKMVKPQGLPLNVWAPSVSVIDKKVYYCCNEGTFTTDDLLSGRWKKQENYPKGIADPAIFQDLDGKVYLYDGCSDTAPSYVTELDRTTLMSKGAKQPVIYQDYLNHGWEVSGDLNLGRMPGDTAVKNLRPWIEGSYMNRIGSTYYLQYSAPGTQFRTYGDGLYTAKSPAGPFTYQSYSPFSFKPTGFIPGAGHSATLIDGNNNLWHISTGVISVRNSVERRLVLYPAAVSADGQLMVDTYLGDYPRYASGTPGYLIGHDRPDWMLLSYEKASKVSSVWKIGSGNEYAANKATDENIKTWWSAQTGNPGEFFQLDLGKNCRINAVQTNFADEGCKFQDDQQSDLYRYKIEISGDGKLWSLLIDRSKKGNDGPHGYHELKRPVMARHLRITNVYYPFGGKFSISDFRIFGSSLGKKPQQVKEVMVKRARDDQRRVTISWKKTSDADFYIVRYGIAPNRLFSNYQIYHADQIAINALNVGTAYFFTVDAVNSSGITKGTDIFRDTVK